MKKVTRKSLDELAKVMPIISEENQKMYVGGTSGYTGGNPPSGTTGSSDGGWTPPPPVPGPLGSLDNPYSIDEALELMDAGHWGGGYVSGWGYVSPEVEVKSPSGDIGGSGSVPNFNWDIPSGDYGKISGGSDGFTGTYPNGSSFDLGSASNPYSYNQAIAMMNSGTWTGGYVMGYGYMPQEVNITPSYGGGGGGGGGSDSSYVQPGNTGSCLGDLHPVPDTESSHPPYNDDMSVITGVAPGATPREIWAETKYVYFRLAKELGIDLYSLDKRIHVSSERSANAWVDNVDRSINLGNGFFQMNIQDRLAVLIHEYTHLGQNTPSTVVKDLSEPVLLANGLIPPDIDKYIRENHIDDYPNPISPGLQYAEYIKQYTIASPVYYENELNAYLEEKRLCPNVSASYAREREFRIWYYSELLKISQEYYFYN
jgi:hypothetical protein